MKAFTNQEKGYRTQLATAYVVFMMGGSYFQSCDCKNKIEEKHLFLHYAEMPKQKQMDLETKILRIMDKLNKEFLEQIQMLRCEVHFKQEKEDNQDAVYYVKFTTGGFEAMECKIKGNGEVEIELL